MKKTIKSLLLIAVIAMGFVGCEKNEDAPAAKEFTITFNTNGGSSVASQKVKEGEKAIQPANPKKPGYTFVEWKLDTIKYDFNTPVIKNIFLTAKWQIITYTITFNTDGGSEVLPQTVDSGNVATKPSPNPTKQDSLFVEWQLDGINYDFKTPVKGDINLVAKWVYNIIHWTHIDGSKQYANGPSNGYLHSSLLTSAKDNIKSIDFIPSSVTTIATFAFDFCYSLESVNIPSSVTYIGSHSFNSCRSLTNLTMNNVTHIETNAFSYCSALKSIVIPNVNTIERSAFSDCRSLTDITISNVASIERTAFNSCNITNVNGNPHNGLFYSTGLTGSELTSYGGTSKSIIIPNNVTIIGRGTFALTDITSVIIPNSVNGIGRFVFSGCSSLTSVRIEATIPPTAILNYTDTTWDAFVNTHPTLSIEVPSESVQAYKTAPYWIKYADKIVGY